MLYTQVREWIKFSFIHIVYHISKKRTSVLFKVQKRGDVKVSNVTCGYALSSAAIELPRIPAFYPKKKYKSVVYKRRIAMTEENACRYLLSHKPIADCQISHEIDYCMQHYRRLAPKVLISYEREAFYGN